MKVISSILFLLAALALGAGLVTFVIGIGSLWLRGILLGSAAVLGLLGWITTRAAHAPSRREHEQVGGYEGTKA